MTNEATPITLEGADGIKLAVDRRGDPGRPVVVLLQGAGQTRHAWHRTAGRLTEGFCTVAVDLRGHGDCDRAPGGDDRRHAFAADIQALRRQLGPLSAVVGASLGGISALLAPDQQPGGIADALVLVDITPRIEKAGSDRIVAFMADRPEGFTSVEAVAEAVAAYNPHRTAPNDLDGLRRRPSPRRRRSLPLALGPKTHQRPQEPDQRTRPRGPTRRRAPTTRAVPARAGPSRRPAHRRRRGGVRPRRPPRRVSRHPWCRPHGGR